MSKVKIISQMRSGDKAQVRDMFSDDEGNVADEGRSKRASPLRRVGTSKSAFIEESKGDQGD